MINAAARTRELVLIRRVASGTNLVRTSLGYAKCVHATALVFCSSSPNTAAVSGENPVHPKCTRTEA
jgi:hypothetical protein